jgi:hypothetical protein
MPANKYEAFETAVIHRSRIATADYNPRIISEEAKKKLKRFMKSKQFGLLAPLVWNVLTGTLVSGHQRLEVLDALHGHLDYELTVAQVELSEEDEVKANVFLNNPSAQGQWDYDVLTQLADLGDFDFEKDFGFSSDEIELIFGPPEEELDQITADGMAQLHDMIPDKPQPVEVDETASSSLPEEEAEKFRQLKKEAREKAKLDNLNGDGYRLSKADVTVTVVFKDAETKRGFMRLISRPETERNITAEHLFECIENGF